jgi:hypothetical protein
MNYYSGNDNDDGERPFDFEEVLQDCRDHEAQIVEATGDRDICVGLHNSNSYEYEVWVDGGKFGVKALYFADFEEMRIEAKKLYPDADWEDVGW